MTPILEICIVWHPDDRQGNAVAEQLLDHFQGTAYSGLIGDTVEVYTRSLPWAPGSDAPRPLPFQDPASSADSTPRYSAVVPVVGVCLQRSLGRSDSGWRRYLEAVVDAAEQDERVKILPLGLPGSEAHTIIPLDRYQRMDPAAAHDPAVLCREVAQQVTQMVSGEPPDRLTVFCSYTKRYSVREDAEEVAGIVRQVRDRIASTHLAAFVDEIDLQPGSDWQSDIARAVKSSSLLAVRTDVYASRDWCQREMLEAKHADRPVVTLHAVKETPERGSFLMDHVPVIAYQRTSRESMDRSIDDALNLLVDRTLRRTLWKALGPALQEAGIDWAPSEAPELVTAVDWISKHRAQGDDSEHITIMHPDPPLGHAEHEVIARLFRLAGVGATVDIVTPRTYAARGGRVLQ